MRQNANIQIFILQEPKGIFLTALSDDHPLHCTFDLNDQTPKAGDIYLGRVLRVEKARAWIDVGSEKPGLCYSLYPFVEGESHCFRIQREGSATPYAQKGPLVALAQKDKNKYLKETEKLKPPFKLAAADPEWKMYVKSLVDACPIIVNTLDLYHELCALGKDTSSLKSDMSWSHLMKEVWVSFLDPVVPLPGGGWLLFEEGETLTAIDVNTSAYDQKGATITNDFELFDFCKRAGEVCFEQIKLRHYSGRIVIDFPSFKNKEFYSKLWKHLKGLIVEKGIYIPGFTRTGLFELTRSRQSLSIPQKLKRIHFKG